MSNELLERILSERGYVEDFHKVLAEKDPDFLRLYLDMWDSVFKKGNLDKKTASLVRLAAISVLQIEVGLDHSMDMAKAAGASEKEILDVIKIAYLFSGNATLIPALTMAKKKLKMANP